MVKMFDVGDISSACAISKARNADFIDLGVAESYPTLRPILEREGVIAACAEAFRQLG